MIKSIASAIVETGRDLPIGRSNRADALSVIVNVVVTALPDGVMVVGAKEHVVPLGNPEHVKLTGALNPY